MRDTRRRRARAISAAMSPANSWTRATKWPFSTTSPRAPATTSSPRSGFIEGDILDYRRDPQGHARAIDAVIHLAAAKAAGESMVEAREILAPEPLRARSTSSTRGARPACSSSSSPPRRPPTASRSYLPIDEKHPTEPENYYGFTKLEIERILGWYDRLKGLRYAALRYFNAAGYDTRGRISRPREESRQPDPARHGGGRGHPAQAQGLRHGLLRPRTAPACATTCTSSDLARGHVAALDWISRERQEPRRQPRLGGGALGPRAPRGGAPRHGQSPSPPRWSAAGGRATPPELVASSALAKELLGWEARDSDAGTLIASTWAAYKRRVADSERKRA